MQLKPKANSIITHALTGDVLTFKVKGAGEVQFDLTKPHADNTKHAALHGWIQRISDAAAMPRDTKTGLAASVFDKLDAMTELVEHYESGAPEWKRTGDGSGGKSIIVLAVARVKACDYETAKAMIQKSADAKFDGDFDKARDHLAQAAAIMEAVDAIRAERRKPASLDADEALNELQA